MFDFNIFINSWSNAVIRITDITHGCLKNEESLSVEKTICGTFLLVSGESTVTINDSAYQSENLCLYHIGGNQSYCIYAKRS